MMMVADFDPSLPAKRSNYKLFIEGTPNYDLTAADLMVPRIGLGRIAHKTDETRKGLKPINSKFIGPRLPLLAVVCSPIKRVCVLC
jgi:hypothetical protein